MFKRIWVMIRARNIEFLRDRSALAWNILFPFLIIIGFSVLFGDDKQVLYKVGIIDSEVQVSSGFQEQYKKFRNTRFVDFVEFKSESVARDKLLHHKLDLLIDPLKGKYWISSSSPKGYIVEKLLRAGLYREGYGFIKESVKGREIPYIEWLFPGILCMNMMFSALFGVGYVVVRYRKNGALKRLSVTPLKTYEFLSAQVISRMFLLFITTTIVFVGCLLIYGFEVRGSYFTLILVFGLGGFSMISLALLIASRSSSEEFTGGILNLITWPMMFLSEVWFSLEGAHPWVKKFSNIFPLSHMVNAARKIMNDGSGLFDVGLHIIVLALMSFFFLFLGSILFRWQKN